MPSIRTSASSKVDLALITSTRSISFLKSAQYAQEILIWAASTFEGLFQETAFGPSGNVITDIIASENLKIPVLFIDTLHHFKETLDLASKSQAKYGYTLHTYRSLMDARLKPSSLLSMARSCGRMMKTLMTTWSRSSLPAEPTKNRIFVLLSLIDDVAAKMVTGLNSKSLEIEKGVGMFKLNPLATWSFSQVWAYLRANEIPYNTLLDQGYKSIGDYHSTKPVQAGGDERSGRWSGSTKTECGLHKDYFAMRSAFMARKKTTATEVHA